MKGKFKHIRLLADYLARTQQQSDRGYVLITVLGVGIAMLGLLSTYMVVARTERMGVNASRDSSVGFSAAEAGLNLRAEALRQDFLGFNRPSGTPPSSSFCATSDTNSANDFRCINYLFPAETTGQLSTETTGQPNRVATTYVQDNTEVDPSCPIQGPDRQARCEPRLGRVPSGEQFEGLSMQEYTYRIYGIGRQATQLDAQNRITENSPVEGIMEMQVRNRLIPMFQFAAFYSDDLEISPGPHMLFGGPIHTNRNLMLAGWAGIAGLRINGQITVANGQIYNAVVPDNCGNDCSVRSRQNSPDGVHLFHPARSQWLPLQNGRPGGVGATSSPLDYLHPRNPLYRQPFGNQVRVGINPVSLPSFGSQQNFLRCGSNDTQDICSRADINITYNPPVLSSLVTPTKAEMSVIPFTVAAQDRTDAGDVSAGRALSFDELRSLRQPVLVTSENTGGGNTIPGTRGSVSTTRTADNLDGVCAADTNEPTTTLTGWLASNTTERDLLAANRTQIQNALRVALLSHQRPVDFPHLNFNLLLAGANVPAAAPNHLVGLVEANPSNDATLRQSIAFYFRQSLVTQTNEVTAINIINALRQSPANATPNNTNPMPPMRTIAAVANGSCFVSAPIQEILRYRSDREKDIVGNDRNIRMLQTNIASLAIWNRDGRYITFNPNGSIRDTNGGTGFTAATPTYVPDIMLGAVVCPNPVPSGFVCGNNTFSSAGGVRSFLYRVLDADASAPATSFQRHGYAAADRSHGGMVVHYGMATNTPAYNFRRSPYAFALVGGRQLFGRARYNGYNDNPAGVTFAGAQAFYVQGDLNNYLTNANDPTFEVPPVGVDPATTSFNANSPNTLVWQPASILADSINVLSNNCRNLLFDRILKTGNGQNCNEQLDATPLDDSTGTRPGAAPTTTRVAFLSGTDRSGGVANDATYAGGFSGGIQNYPRYAEGWGSGNPHIYAGSFVSLGLPQEVSGRWDNQAYGPPRRIWGFETRFNDAANLPPLTPRFVSMQQEIFRRRFNR